ncbi:MAG: UDP-N-acetylmuramoyl-L-alanyl-D-glutamate--2,6-diaminopimelate ligase [Terriglobia bacterium]
MRLHEILDGIEFASTRGPAEVEIAAVRYDSRAVNPGDLFVAIRGEQADGDDYVASALTRGALAIVSEQPAPAPFNRTWVQVPSARRTLAVAAANFYRHPARGLKLIGVTGTNGKTTTTYLLESILRTAGHPTGLIGTVEYRSQVGQKGCMEPAHHTTPESLDLQARLAEWRDGGVSWGAMEVSSHGLALDRVYALPFAAAVFTNLARDHLDFHGDFQNYFEAKQRLFLGHGAPPPPVVALNSDDPYGQRLRARCRGRVMLLYGSGEGAQVTAREISAAASGLSFILSTPVGSAKVRSPLVGWPNLSNILAAAAATLALDFPLDTVVAGIEALTHVPGRFERIEAGQPFTVVVDFAHTDLAFETLLQTARELTRGRVLIVFGCGGDRDRTKRPVMGEIAARHADTVILTTDNPRSEDPVRILNDILVGVQKAGANYEVVTDRAQAFARAFELARAGDLVLLAGKGHQREQIFRDHVEPWNERESARAVLRRMGFSQRVSQFRPAALRGH